MTKKEYEKLLQSDYWKGFSYSLIKERNFTCEDCGRRFYNQRNKLQVHHLVYRDINPWSYKPEEMIVLCEECHKKRHGIWQEPIQKANTTYNPNPFGYYTKSYSYSTETREKKPYHSTSQNEADRWGNPIGADNSCNINDRNPFPEEPQNRFKWKYVLYAILFFLILSFGVNSFQKDKEENVKVYQTTLPKSNGDVENSKTSITENSETYVNENSGNIDFQQAPTGTDITITNTPEVIEESTGDISMTVPATNVILQRNIEDNEQKPKAVSSQPQREKSIYEILDERTHANVVRQAKQAGVSAEGTTSEILDRITHANVVRQAKQVGVSAEGTTSEILDRITHANVVRQAKQVGVSTEGTTSEILDRITRKNLERLSRY